MTVRAKFKVTQKTEHEPWAFTDDTRTVPQFTTTQVKLAPVMAKEGEDSVFGKYTPGGSVEMFINNDAAAAKFEVGKAYYVDFTPAE